MVYKVIILERAVLELEDAFNYYETIQNSLGIKFLFEYEEQIKTLYNFPYFEKKYNKIHVLPLKKFPYSIHFSIDEYLKLVAIHAIVCNYQNPNLTRIKL